MNEQITRGQLPALRRWMKEQGLDGLVVTMGDYHGSEYTAPFFKSVRFFSGFTGSAGTLAVTQEKAGLWTDGRYFLQAEEQLQGTGFELYRAGMPGVPTVAAFLAAELPEGGCLGFDGRCVTVHEAEVWQKALEGKKLRFAADCDPAGTLWTERPPMVFHTIVKVAPELAGESISSKLARVRDKMREQGAGAHLLTSLDDIAWLLNLRGSDVSCNPVFFAYMLLTDTAAKVFLRKEALTDEAAAQLAEAGVETAPYEDFFGAVGELPAEAGVLYDPGKASALIRSLLPEGCTVREAQNPSTDLKCVKNEAEIRGLLDSHYRDGLAMVRFLYALSKKTPEELAQMTELDAEKMVDAERRKAGALSLSFGTISAYGENGAVIHYKAEAGSCAKLAPRGFLTVDSGGQYETGTTDITRTIPLGPLTEREKHAYTAVLRGTLRLQSAVFPAGCDGQNLDILARAALWQEGLDYRHGTGHGVGFRLNVHEGPNAFRWQPGKASAVFVPGMVTTDEPGYYEDGAFGLRIENELLCEKAMTTEYGDFLRFRVLTLCPIATEPVLTEEMDASELKELNRYNAAVREALESGLSEEEAAWLRRVTQPVGTNISR